MKFEILGPSLEVVQVVESDAATVRIGKNASCELILNDDSVTRIHAVIEKSAAGYKLSDRMSTAGTFVNDQKVEPSKPVMLTSGSIVKFGNVSVRVTLDAGIEEMSSIEEAEEEGGATMAMNAPSLEDLQAGISSLEASAPAAPAAPAAAAPAAPSAPAVPSTPAAPAMAAAAAAPAASKPSGFGGFGNGAFGQSSAPQTTIIKKKKRPVSFERRFLSARGKGNRCVLEAAMIWKENVLAVKQFKANNGTRITVGTTGDCDFKVDANLLNSNRIVVAQCAGSQWEIDFNNNYEGFVLVGDKKTEFSTASTAEFGVPKMSNSLPPGSLACTVNGDVRAKFMFGDVSILIHYVDSAIYAAPLLGGFSIDNCGGLIASLLIHFALFSVILFATDRVDALMIDRILTASRFAAVVEEPIEEEDPEEDKQDEEEPEEEEPEEETEVVRDAPDTPFAANTNNNNAAANNGSGMSRGEAAAAAQATGLLAQAQAMDSMLAAAMDTSALDNLDWSSFDSSAAASAAGYGLGTTGAGGGGAGLGGFGGGGFGPGGAGGSGAIRAAGAGYNGNLGKKGEAKPVVKMANPEVTGSLDKRIIQKVVRQHSGELRNCYEKELNKVKGLNGRVLVVWLISPQGAVTKALVKESTLKNKNVENCVINSIKYWRFPAPKGGGMVQIEYPFNFEQSGGN